MFMDIYKRTRIIFRKLGMHAPQYLKRLNQLERDFEYSFKQRTIEKLDLMLEFAIDQLEDQAAPSVFLCHAFEDSKRVDETHSLLHAEGFEPWLSKYNILPGENWTREITKAITAADFVAIFFSRNSICKTGNVNREILAAVEESKARPFDKTFLVPIRLERCDIPPIKIDTNTLLSDLQWVDLFRGDNVACSKLVNGLWAAWHKEESRCLLEEK